MSGVITFWEGNGATQDQVGNALEADQHYSIDCKDGDQGFDNDEARSVKLVNIKSPVTITVYDSPDKSKDDDWTRIEVTEAFEGEVIVRTFEESGKPHQAVEVSYYSDNGLDGKVSYIEVEPA
ncbi:hypothetical protein MADA3029_510121 [Vibrio nigripulchritudo MADA3029]|uniref:hypothetical protein n=1 Tax=Vibrio nigripulchritudo TaxID=28173 RepID=UPI0003B225F0|nr:hypothetical protein [Vibrio nigripulchritudo]CCN49561.1 hypothetical protein VIBNIMADA3020_750120 [Vibrio nigripulchritudo MADA3020]CCN51398.1 hypothetical protein VIBNIMADA3021_1040121 [Vibrio nigripulchritudo MADA3021]CCN60033.1 hypothetical protein MADA3029_510121 [Vibrio nigripulchritudo MADA3029]